MKGASCTFWREQPDDKHIVSLDDTASLAAWPQALSALQV